MSERIISLSSMPSGFALTLTDVPMYSQALGLGGFALLHSEMDSLMAANPVDFTLDETKDGLMLDFANQHAWSGIHSLVDLAAELIATQGGGIITAKNVRFAEELQLAPHFARRVGIKLTTIADGLSFSVEATDANDFLAKRLDHEGLEVLPDLWWQIYEIARSALAPDTAVSRRHAGVQIVNEDGSVIGRTDNDDDADVSFLARGARENA